MANTKVAFAAGLAGGVALGRLVGAEQAMFARLAGWTIARPDAAGWITDFLNAAYYRRPPARREVDDLRYAFAVVTTHWHAKGGRRLNGADVLPFHRAFGRDRFFDRHRSPRGTLSREQLEEGSACLFGDWFPGGWCDDGRRGWGIVFASEQDKASYLPEIRLELANVGELTPPVAPGEEQSWHTYKPVELPSAARAIELLSRTETWSDYASEIGRFTALRTSDLPGQTFEIEVAAGTAAGRPLFQRGYVTVTRVVDRESPELLAAYFEELEDGLARFGRGEPRAVPEGGEAVLGIDLTTHKGHFMGRGRNRILIFEHEGRSFVRAAGTWDPMPWHVETAYRVAGRESQHAFWGRGQIVRKSMLHQLARAPA